MLIKLNSPLLKLFPKWVDAFTIGQTIYCRGSNPSPRLLAHEAKHCEQYKEHGIIGFLFLYLLHFIREFLKCGRLHKAYLNIPFEIEARLAEKETNNVVQKEQA